MAAWPALQPREASLVISPSAGPVCVPYTLSRVAPSALLGSTRNHAAHVDSCVAFTRDVLPVVVQRADAELPERMYVASLLQPCPVCGGAAKTQCNSPGTTTMGVQAATRQPTALMTTSVHT
jgi:hypothetical protein